MLPERCTGNPEDTAHARTLLGSRIPLWEDVQAVLLATQQRPQAGQNLQLVLPSHPGCQPGRSVSVTTQGRGS